MTNHFQLGSLGNDELLASLSNLVAKDRRVTADLLAHLAECDERRLHLDLGFASLFAYCTESLGFCEATAWRRITAARVCRRFPEAFALVASGKLHLSALCSLKPHLDPDNAGELFELCRNQSARRVDELLAARFPSPDVPDAIRRLPTRRAATAGAAVGLETLTSDAGSAGTRAPPDVQRPAEVDRATSGSAAPAAMEQRNGRAPTVANMPAQAPSAPARLEPLSADRFGVRFTADAEFCALLERVRGLAAHRLPSGDLLVLLKRGLEAYERELTKERFGVGRKRRGDGSKTAARPSNRSRHIPVGVASEVYLRDDGQCTFISDDGRRCAARGRLELDHVKPWAVGGEPTVQNLRLRCSAHNLRHAENCFGRARIRAALAEPPRPNLANSRAAPKSDES